MSDSIKCICLQSVRWSCLRHVFCVKGFRGTGERGQFVFPSSAEIICLLTALTTSAYKVSDWVEAINLLTGLAGRWSYGFRFENDGLGSPMLHYSEEFSVVKFEPVKI